MEQKTRMAYTHRAKQCLITSNLANLTKKTTNNYEKKKLQPRFKSSYAVLGHK